LSKSREGYIQKRILAAFEKKVLGEANFVPDLMFDESKR